MKRNGYVYVLATLMVEMGVYMMKTKEMMKKKERGQHAMVFAQVQQVLVLQDGNSSFEPASCI